MKKNCLFFLAAIFAFPVFSFSEALLPPDAVKDSWHELFAEQADDEEYEENDEWNEEAAASWAEKAARKKAEERKQKRQALKEIIPLVESTQKFSFAFYRELLKDNDHADENLFFSPLSLHFCLSMTAMGANGETQKQMLDALHLKDFTQAGKRRFKEFGKYFRYSGNRHKDEEVDYFMVNRFWCDSASPVLEDFREDLKHYFDATVANMNLKSEPEVSRKAINKIIAQDTKQRIKNLLSPGAITKDSAFVLANTMFFHGMWQHTFEEKDTRPGTFFLADGTEKETLMMGQKEMHETYLDETFRAISIPYMDWSRRCSMVILLPNEKTGLPALEKKLSPELWEKITENLRTGEVDLKIPKFRFDTRLNLETYLERMGITEAFIPEKADFSGTSETNLWLGGAVHGASVEVDELGTVAVAATADWMFLGGAGSKSMIFHADHPFLFFIRDDTTGAILFMGRFVSPP